MNRAAWTAAICCACAALRALAQAPPANPTFSLLKSCGEGAAVVAAISGSDPVAIRYSFAGASGTCFAVTAKVDGKSIDGYLLGDAHPALRSFEHEVQQAKVIPPPPPPAPPAPEAPAAKPAEPPKPEAQSFAGFRAVSIDGWPVDLSRERSPNVLIYFWSAGNRAAIRAADAIEAIYDAYHTRGVYMVGVAAAGSLEQVKRVVSENEMGGLTVLDHAGLAARYHVDPAKPFMLLDQDRKVIASAATAQGLEPMLDELTKHRRPRP